jgi:GNAT superfamily N-acetyltransferase
VERVLAVEEAASVRPAVADDAPRLATALARAFADDPGFSHLLPEPHDRTERLERFFRTELEGIAMTRGRLWTTEHVVGAAIWMPPDAWRVPVSATLREVPAAVRVFGRRLPLALRSRLRMERRHPAKPPHWYLAVMGVDPEWQGRGLGTALMLPALETLDSQGIPAYLESSTPRSRALYQRNGFEVTGEFNLPANGPPLWAMWRGGAGTNNGRH